MVEIIRFESEKLLKERFAILLSSQYIMPKSVKTALPSCLDHDEISLAKMPSVYF